MGARRTQVAAMLMVFLAQACATRVVLPHAPSRTATLARRLRFYQTYQAHSAHGVAIYPSNTIGSAAPVQTTWNTLLLANGTVVQDPRDLVRVVGEGSPTAAAAAQAARLREASNWLLGIGIAVAVVGGILSFASMRDTDATVDNPVFWTGFGCLIASGLALGTANWGLASPLSAARLDAFRSYNGALRERLGLCESAGLTYDCHEPPTYAPSPAATAMPAAPPALPPPPPDPDSTDALVPAPPSSAAPAFPPPPPGAGTSGVVIP